MKFIRVKPNETLEALAARVAEAPDAGARERNVAALARANPHLANRPCGEGRARAYAAVPDDLEGRIPEEEPDREMTPAEATLRRVARRLGAALDRMPVELEAAKARIGTERKTLERDILEDVASNRPEVARALGCARARTEERLERLEALEVVHEQATVQVREDLGRMARDAGDVARELRDFAGARGRPSPDREGRGDETEPPREEERDEERRRRGAEKREKEGEEERRRRKEAEAKKKEERRREKEAEEERRREEAERRAAERAERLDLPTVRELPGFLGEIRDPRVVRRLKERDERTTAQPVFERRLRELEERDTEERDTDGRDTDEGRDDA